MSSHHFVIENQEPALIIANGLASSNALLSELLEWSPYVVVLDGALQRVLERRIKFDAILGDFDSLNVDEIDLQNHQPLDVLHRPDQTKTDLEKALDFLLEEKKVTAANIIWAGGLRTDHHLNNLFTLAKYSNRMKLCMYDDFTRIFSLPNSFEKHYPKGQILSLMPIGEVRGVSTQNLKYNVSDFDMHSLGRTGSSNEVNKSGLVKITFESGVLLLMEAFERSPYQT
jgi:thiamine pyrophosphokinase